MLIEIPDPEIILGIVVAFFVGLFALYIFYKIKPLIKQQERHDPSYLERLEFYERQLIDMKIRMDSLDVGNIGTKSADVDDVRQMVEKVPRREQRIEQKYQRRSTQAPRVPNMDYNNTVDYVLGLITDKSMTSRDIQTASQRSREHTSRLMKKLYQEGYVERNTKTKPFTYSITDKGRSKIGVLEYLQKTAA